jgi:N-glycosylase/DNA lyase
LLKTAQWIADGRIDLEAIAAMETPRAMEVLCSLPGVGRKIANCVLLFACERLDAVPVDVWIARVARSMRGDGSLAELEAFSRERFGPYAGYVQQYLFHHARVSKTLPAQ